MIALLTVVWSLLTFRLRGARGCGLEDMRYDDILWPGTHNSAINLGEHTLLRPSDAEGGSYKSVAAHDFQYVIMDQRLSVRDQLEQGIRVIDLEIAEIGGSGSGKGWACESSSVSSDRCEEKWTLRGRCFTNCPFIVTHGTVREAVKFDLGFAYPEDVFEVIADFAKRNPGEIVTLLLIVTHGNSMPDLLQIQQRLNTSGLLPFVWNADPSVVFSTFPTIKEMRDEGKNVFISVNPSIAWGPSLVSSHCTARDITQGGATETCMDGVPCLEGWDAVTFACMDPARAVLSTNPSVGPNSTDIFTIENLSSRRGRSDNSTSYDRLPNELEDIPFQAGGNPAQAQLAAEYDHIVALVDRWATLLAPYRASPSWILVDFFNTSTSSGKPSRSLKSNPREGLIRAVSDINARRVRAFCGRGD
eukprot:g1696.t1